MERSLECSGVGVRAIGNESIATCDGAEVDPAVRAAVAALQAAVTAGAGEAALGALEAALLAVPGFNISLLLPRGTAIPAGANLTALPPATRDALTAAANVSSVGEITSFDQIVAPDGTIAGGRLGPADLLPLLPVNDTVALVQDIDCREAFVTGPVCACPLDFRGERCESRRSLVVTLALADARVRRCLERPHDAPLYPDADPAEPESPAVLGWAGADLLGLGQPPCLFFSRPGSGLANAPSEVALRLSATAAFHPSDRPAAWSCNASLLTRDRAAALLAARGLTFATATGPPPFYGLGCAEASFRYRLGPTLDAAASASPAVTVAARVWSFDALSDARFAAAVDVLNGSQPLHGPPRPAKDAASALPRPARPLTLTRLWDDGATGPARGTVGAPVNATARLYLTVPASDLPARFRPAGRAHLEVAAWQALPTAEHAYPPVDVVPSAEPYGSLPGDAPRPLLTALSNAAFAARLRRVPPLPVRRPWPFLSLALDDAEWEAPVVGPDPNEVLAAALVTAGVLGLAAVLGFWWFGWCAVVEDALAMDGWMARSQIVANARAEAQAASGGSPAARAAVRLNEDQGGALGDIELHSMVPPIKPSA